MEIKSTRPDKHKFFNKLSAIYNSPDQLYYLGKIPEVEVPVVAIVGSRKPTAYGRQIAQQLALELTQKGVIVVSGLALGIDAIAHKGCLEAGGVTIAVLGSGLNYITPYTNRSLAERILNNGGAIISEYPSSQPALPHQFLERNRIVSGLADGVIVVEAAARSGTLSTAAHALSQGREVFAVPGPITSPMSVGCHNLIKQGAQLITSADDVCVALGLNQPSSAKQPTLPILSDPLQTQIIQLVADDVIDGDQIIQQLKLSPDELNFHLTMLEINDHIAPLGANRWMLKP